MEQQSIFTARGTTVKIVVAIVIFCLVSVVATDKIKWQPLKQLTFFASKPFYWLSELPSDIYQWVEINIQSPDSLSIENAKFKNENLILKARQLTFNEILYENTRLRHLLNANELVEFKVLIGEIYGIVPNTYGHRIVVNRGSQSGVYIGQPVIADSGVFGQIIDVAKGNSKVLLISDSDHALSVQNLKSGYRTIAEGIGDFNYLKLRYVPITTQIQLGDEFVTSGLDGIYPKGYPVGVVSEVEVFESDGLIDVTLAISAQLKYTKNILLLFTDETL